MFGNKKHKWNLEETLKIGRDLGHSPPKADVALEHSGTRQDNKICKTVSVQQ